MSQKILLVEAEKKLRYRYQNELEALGTRLLLSLVVGVPYRN